MVGFEGNPAGGGFDAVFDAVGAVNKDCRVSLATSAGAFGAR